MHAESGASSSAVYAKGRFRWWLFRRRNQCMRMPPWRWGWIWRMLKHPDKSYDQYEVTVLSTWALHITKSIKPWPWLLLRFPFSVGTFRFLCLLLPAGSLILRHCFCLLLRTFRFFCLLLPVGPLILRHCFCLLLLVGTFRFLCLLLPGVPSSSWSAPSGFSVCYSRWVPSSFAAVSVCCSWSVPSGFSVCCSRQVPSSFTTVSVCCSWSVPSGFSVCCSRWVPSSFATVSVCCSWSVPSSFSVCCSRWVPSSFATVSGCCSWSAPSGFSVCYSRWVPSSFATVSICCAGRCCQPSWVFLSASGSPLVPRDHYDWRAWNLDEHIFNLSWFLNYHCSWLKWSTVHKRPRYQDNMRWEVKTGGLPWTVHWTWIVRSSERRTQS